MSNTGISSTARSRVACGGPRFRRLGVLATGIALLVAVSACAPEVKNAGSGPAPTSGGLPAPVVSPGTPAATRPPANREPAATPLPASFQSGVSIGQKAPDFTLPTPDGSKISLSQYRGKTVLINFWATWCPACKEEMPALNDLYQSKQDQGLVVLAVDLGEDPKTVGEFIAKSGYSFPVVVDQDTSVSRIYQAVSIPTSYIVDPEGVIRDRIIGAMTATAMQAKVERFMGAPGQGAPEPRSVAQLAGAANDEVVATIGEEKITLGDVNRRLDVMLAIERLDSGAVLDPSRPADQPELRQRQHYALDEVIDDRLMADAARRGNVGPKPEEIEGDVGYLTSRAGGESQLAAELARHGVTVADVRSLSETWSMASAYVFQELLPGVPEGTSPTEAAGKWLEGERARRGVKILNPLN